METRTVEQVESWKTRSFADGFAGLRELSDGEFSGAVRAGGAWLFMLNGRIIGVYEGSLDDFENADGTAYAAPHPSLPLLFSMQAKGGDTRAKYYTNDTPLSEVNSTLTDGKFTGYIELSENVLSGDYYVAYYGGRSKSVAFVGAGEQVVTGDEAFERAEDEVGIYEVRDVEIEVTDVPEPEGADEPEGAGESDASGSGPTGGVSAEPSSGGPSGKESSGKGQSSTGQSGEGTPSESSSSAKTDPIGDSPTSSAADAEGGQSSTDGIRHPESDGKATKSEATDNEAADTATADSTTTDTATADSTTTDTATTKDKTSPSTDTDSTSARATTTEATGDDEQSESSDSENDDGDDAFSEEQEWREATTIPSLDPDRTEGSNTSESQPNASATTAAESDSKTSSATSPKPKASKSERGKSPSKSTSPSESTSKSSANSTRSNSASARSSTSDSKTPRDSSSTSDTEVGARAGTSTSSATGDGDDEAKAKIQKLRSQLKQRKQQVQKLKKRVSSVESERNEFKRERNALRQEVERLEAKLETVSSSGSDSRARQLDRAQAFDGTNLFVRYESKGKATLEEAAEGEASADDVNANLRLEHHTQFEADDVSVDGREFEAFLTDSFEHRFVSWIIEDLLYEIQDTGHQGDLRNLYQSIPKIDRVDLHGSVSAGNDEEDTRKESFDVIMRDRMGNPLLVADLNDSRDPTTGDMMGSLVDAASGVSEAHDELSGAFQVTESFFQPEALETAESATTGGFLSREKRESFVKLSRKRGYHLCLVESRSGGFHLNVPEL